MKPRHDANDPTDPTFLKPVILSNFIHTRTCPEPLCAACQLARMSRRGAQTSVQLKHAHKFMRLKRNDLFPGQTVSLDQYDCRRCTGRLLHTYGKEKEEERYHGGTIAVDHASGLIFIQHQVSLRAGETILAKRNFERLAHSFGVTIRQYHSDNGVFASKAFLDEAKALGQTVDFSGVGAHHQNGVAERAIKTISSWARAMIVHAGLHWPAQSGTLLSFWPYAMDQAVFLWNNLPSRETGLSPLEVFGQQKCAADYEHLR